MNGRNAFVALGAVLAGLGVAAGAFGAHALREVLSPDRLEVFHTAVRYQMIHALALMLVGVMADDGIPVLLRRGGIAFVAGIVLFSGSLYLLVLTDTAWFGAVTPFGGVAFMAGWGLVATHAVSRRRPPRTGA